MKFIYSAGNGQREWKFRERTYEGDFLGNEERERFVDPSRIVSSGFFFFFLKSRLRMEIGADLREFQSLV